MMRMGNNVNPSDLNRNMSTNSKNLTFVKQDKITFISKNMKIQANISDSSLQINNGVSVEKYFDEETKSFNEIFLSNLTLPIVKFEHCKRSNTSYMCLKSKSLPLCRYTSQTKRKLCSKSETKFYNMVPKKTRKGKLKPRIRPPFMSKNKIISVESRPVLHMNKSEKRPHQDFEQAELIKQLTTVVQILKPNVIQLFPVHENLETSAVSNSNQNKDALLSIVVSYHEYIPSDKDNEMEKKDSDLQKYNKRTGQEENYAITSTTNKASKCDSSSENDKCKINIICCVKGREKSSDKLINLGYSGNADVNTEALEPFRNVFVKNTEDFNENQTKLESSKIDSREIDLVTEESFNAVSEDQANNKLTSLDYVTSLYEGRDKVDYECENCMFENDTCCVSNRDDSSGDCNALQLSLNQDKVKKELPGYKENYFIEQDTYSNITNDLEAIEEWEEQIDKIIQRKTSRKLNKETVVDDTSEEDKLTQTSYQDFKLTVDEQSLLKAQSMNTFSREELATYRCDDFFPQTISLQECRCKNVCLTLPIEDLERITPNQNKLQKKSFVDDDVHSKPIPKKSTKTVETRVHDHKCEATDFNLKLSTDSPKCIMANQKESQTENIGNNDSCKDDVVGNMEYKYLKTKIDSLISTSQEGAIDSIVDANRYKNNQKKFQTTNLSYDIITEEDINGQDQDFNTNVDSKLTTKLNSKTLEPKVECCKTKILDKNIKSSTVENRRSNVENQKKLVTKKAGNYVHNNSSKPISKVNSSGSESANLLFSPYHPKHIAETGKKTQNNDIVKKLEAIVGAYKTKSTCPNLILSNYDSKNMLKNNTRSPNIANNEVNKDESNNDSSKPTTKVATRTLDPLVEVYQCSNACVYFKVSSDDSKHIIEDQPKKQTQGVDNDEGIKEGGSGIKSCCDNIINNNNNNNNINNNTSSKPTPKVNTKTLESRLATKCPYYVLSTEKSKQIESRNKSLPLNNSTEENKGNMQRIIKNNSNSSRLTIEANNRNSNEANHNKSIDAASTDEPKSIFGNQKEFQSKSFSVDDVNIVEYSTPMPNINTRTSEPIMNFKPPLLQKTDQSDWQSPTYIGRSSSVYPAFETGEKSTQNSISSTQTQIANNKPKANNISHSSSYTKNKGKGKLKKLCKTCPAKTSSINKQQKPLDEKTTNYPTDADATVTKENNNVAPRTLVESTQTRTVKKAIENKNTTNNGNAKQNTIIPKVSSNIQCERKRLSNPKDELKLFYKQMSEVAAGLFCSYQRCQNGEFKRKNGMTPQSQNGIGFNTYLDTSCQTLSDDLSKSASPNEVDIHKNYILMKHKMEMNLLQTEYDERRKMMEAMHQKKLELLDLKRKLLTKKYS